MKKYSEKDLRCAIAYGIGYGQSHPQNQNMASLYLIGNEFINKKLPQLKNDHKKKKTAKEEVSAYSKEFYDRIKNYPDLPK